MIYRIYKDKRHQIVGEGDLPIHGQGFRYVEADADGWIPWHGGDCPLPGNEEVQICTKVGIKNRGIAGDFRWDKQHRGGDIIAYRPILDANPEPGIDVTRLASERQPPEWGGEGLPPVGVECLVRGTPTGSICPAIIDYIDGKHCIWHWKDESGEAIHARIHAMEFRPIRSEEDRVVQEMMDAGHGMTRSSIFCRALYRAGYRRTA